MKMLWKGLIAFVFGVPFILQAQQGGALPILRVAPELHEGIWLNTDEPLKLENLRGKVILLEMWTLGCINCIHTLPTVEAWYETYAEEGLVVIGNHYPEFSYEADLDNLRAAVERFGLTYPIIQDNQRETWTAYRNRYWPTIYLIDKQGQIRYTHIGEGRYQTTENAIQSLLAESYSPPEDEKETEILPIWSLSATETLNVRSGAGTKFERIGSIYPHEAYYILDELDGWYRIKFGDVEGYVSADYVTVTGSQEEEEIPILDSHS